VQFLILFTYWRQYCSLWGQQTHFSLYQNSAVVLNLIRTKCLPILLYGLESLVHWLHATLEFTVICSLMKLFKNGSATITSDCQKFFVSLPITYQIDIRTVRFLETFMISDNGICMLFERHAKSSRNTIFSTYGDNVRLEMCHWWTVLLLVTISIVINYSYCLEVP